MYIKELYDACRGTESDRIVLSIPRMPSPRSGGIRLTPKSGPTGYILNAHKGSTLASFSRPTVLRWLLKNFGEELTSK